MIYGLGLGISSFLNDFAFQHTISFSIIFFLEFSDIKLQIELLLGKGLLLCILRLLPTCFIYYYYYHFQERTTTRIDQMEKRSESNFDSDRGCYFQVGKSLKLGMPIATAFKKALYTWASWVETTINTNRTSIFFRTFESSHWRCAVYYL